MSRYLVRLISYRIYLFAFCRAFDIDASLRIGWIRIMLSEEQTLPLRSQARGHPFKFELLVSMQTK